VCDIIHNLQGRRLYKQTIESLNRVFRHIRWPPGVPRSHHCIAVILDTAVVPLEPAQGFIHPMTDATVKRQVRGNCRAHSVDVISRRNPVSPDGHGPVPTLSPDSSDLICVCKIPQSCRRALRRSILALLPAKKKVTINWVHCYQISHRAPSATPTASANAAPTSMASPINRLLLANALRALTD
jgi:hypothetical protein